MGSHRRRALGANEVPKFLQAVPEGMPKILFETYLRTGARRAELLAVKREDIYQFGDKWVMKLTGKGGKTRDVLLVDDLAKRILKLVPSKDGRVFPISLVTADRWFRKAANDAGIKDSRVTLHSLRHTFASLALSNNADLQSVSDTLGHSNISTTSVYLHSLKRWSDPPEGHVKW